MFVHEWRTTQAKGEIYIVRYADDFVIGCEHKEDAEALLEAIDKRLRENGLILNRDKTRLIRFGRYWQDNEKDGRSETFDFLRFTHKITHPEVWLDLDPGYLLGRAGCGNTARPVL